MLLASDRALARVSGGRDAHCSPHQAIAGKVLGLTPATATSKHLRQPFSPTGGAPNHGLTAHIRPSVIASATTGSIADAEAGALPTRKATLRPRLQRTASTPSTAGAGHPQVDAPAAAAAVMVPRTRTRSAEAAAGEARGGTATMRSPAAARQQQLQQPLLQQQQQRQQPQHSHRELQPRREQQAVALGGQEPGQLHQHQHPQQQHPQQHQHPQSHVAAPPGESLHPRHAGFALRTGLALTFLGTNSGAPTLERNVSCTLVRMPGAVQMVDCGEGTHRQLMSLEGSLDPAEIDGIFITHMHGDHCFGLPAALAMLDEAKAARQMDPARRRHHVYGPPGLAELIRVSMISTGLTRRLQLPLMVSELVNSATSAHPPMPLTEALQQRQQRGQRRQQQRQPYGGGGGRGGGGAAGGGDGAGSLAAADVGPGGPVLLQRLAAQRMQDAPKLQAAVGAVQSRVAALEEIWAPTPPRYPPGGQYGRSGSTDINSSDLVSSVDDESDEGGGGGAGGGRGGGGASSQWIQFVAAEGLYWEFPGCAGVRVRSAQLQHRVPCWGYVFTEARALKEGARKRKVVVLGDTVSSRAIAPLAAGCDVMSHEATFARGMEGKARVAQHSTGWMAGAFAAAIGAQNLVLTHFSSRYREGPRDPESRFSRATGQVEMEQQSWAVAGLLKEASATYGRPNNVFAASDFYTHHVPPPRPKPAAQAPPAPEPVPA